MAVAGVEAAAGKGEICTWCGKDVSADDGFRLSEAPSARAAAFCRLEHVIPWLIKGARWDEPPAAAGSPPAAGSLETCSWCEAGLGEQRLILVRHRGEHRIGDAFCDLEHLGAWAKAGGRFR